MPEELICQTNGQGLVDITASVAAIVSRSGIRDGLCTVFVTHTSASLLINENADPSARHDIESWLNRLVPENDALYTHTLEGPDDMPAHIKATLTASSLGIPVMHGRLGLGTWQGIYLWEHRHAAQRRRLLIHVGS
jgi:secondary thiamine-phosphate synthase enzyme